MSRLCFLVVPAAVTPPELLGALTHSFSADWTLLSRGERGSLLFGRDICRGNGGDECSFTGNGAVAEDRGEGERCGDPGGGGGDGVRARGDRGMFPADFLRGERY